MINQKMGGGRESCAAKATFASYPAENLEGGRLGATSSLCCFRKALPLPDRKIWSGQFSLPCRMATVAWVNTISPPKIWLINTPDNL
ncbi:hypothetical protein ACFQ4Y_02810 [Kroppenstedtia sanguinis]|uniref:Uncharacterized protein n=1 Tax=Kroppenstedtia sanguinis TaxID=1380684 RepID=A0ABW4C8Q0_9BACL